MLPRILSFALMAALLARPADEPEPMGLGCLEHLEIPRYPSLARQARINGLTRVRCSDGQWQWEAKPALFNSIARQVSASARVKKNCQGSRVELIFEFRLRLDSPAGQQDDRITLTAPNRILVTSNPSEMNY